MYDCYVQEIKDKWRYERKILVSMYEGAIKIEKHEYWKAKKLKMPFNVMKKASNRQNAENEMEAYRNVIHGAFLSNSNLHSLPSLVQRDPCCYKNLEFISIFKRSHYQTQI
jgi:hypothetical protein